MKRQDFEAFRAVFALYTISHCSDLMFDEIAEDDLPESLCSGYRAVRESIHSLVESLEQYRASKIDAFMSSCED